MDPEKFINQTKKATSTLDVDIILIEYIDPEYKIKALSNNSATATGHLEVAKLMPKKQNLFEFIFRWDTRAEALDIDIYEDGKISNNLWLEINKNEGNYTGHHTKNIKNMIFEVDINNKKFNKQIFKGKIDVGLYIKLIIKDNGMGVDTVSVCKFANQEMKDKNKPYEIL